MNSKTSLPTLTSSQQEVIDIVADKLFVEKCRWVRGLDLRRRLLAPDREGKRALIQQLVPDFLTLHGTAREDSYSLTPLGALSCKHAAAITELAQELRAFIVSLVDAPDFSSFTWEAVKPSVNRAKRPLVDDDFEVVSFVLFCIGAWAGSGSVGPSHREYTWMRPADPQLEDLLEVKDAPTLFARVQDHFRRQESAVSEAPTLTTAAAQDARITPWGYAALAGGALACAIALLIGLATSSGQSSAQIFYVLLVTLGITVGAFLFGAMKSHARMHGRTGYGAYDFGGPICALILTVIGGFQFSSPSQTFSVLVRASVNGKAPSAALLSVSDALIAGSIRPDGIIRFDAIPSRHLGEGASMEIALGPCRLRAPLGALRLGTIDAPSAQKPDCDLPSSAPAGSESQKEAADSRSPSVTDSKASDYEVTPGPPCAAGSLECQPPTVCSSDHRDAGGQPRCVRVWRRGPEAPVWVWKSGEHCGAPADKPCPAPGICDPRFSHCAIPTVREYF
jgi:hypothetical protein